MFLSKRCEEDDEERFVRLSIYSSTTLNVTENTGKTKMY